MDNNQLRQFFKHFSGSVILKNAGLAILILIALFWLTLFLLRFYTHHGESETVPNLVGMKLDKAMVVLEQHNIHYQIVDSVFQVDKQPGTIVEQVPLPGSTIKRYRDVYITINTRVPPGVAVPDVRDISLRNAQALLTSMGFVVVDIEYVPSEFSSLVQDLKYNGKIMTPGQQIPAGSAVVLVVGQISNDNNSALIPDLQNMTLEQAMAAIKLDSLTVGAVNFDVEPANEQDKANYIVYKQEPAANDSITVGKVVSIWLTKNKEKANQAIEPPDSAVAPAPSSTPAPTSTQPPKENKKEVKKKKEDIEKFF